MAKIRTRKRGSTYSYAFEIGKVDGKRKTIEKGGYSTESQAYDAGVSAYNDWKNGNIGLTNERITLRDFMTSYIENVSGGHLRQTSIDTYHSINKSKITPPLGDYLLEDLTPAILDRWIAGLQRGGASHYSLRSTLALLRHALAYAVHPAGLLTANPAQYIKVPKGAPRTVIERSIISPTTYRALLEEHPLGTPYHIPLLLLYHTGMRLGEVLGLLWDDIDLTKGTISVAHQLQDKRLVAPKTATSQRQILIDQRLVKALRKWQEIQADHLLTLDRSYIAAYLDSDTIVQQSLSTPSDLTPLDPVCTRPDGRIVSKESLSSILRKKGLNAHSFRHTHATMLIEAGATPKAVAGRLGHTDATITQNLYTHDTRKMQEDTLTIFDRLLE